MRNDESRTDLGVVKIHKNVIASIAQLAALEIEGVKEVGGDFKNGLMELISAKSSSRINVDIDRNGEVKIEIPLIIKYGFNLPEIAGRVQENVRNALEKMTNLSIKDINVSMQGIEGG